MTSFPIKWTKGLYSKHSAGAWHQALVRLDDEYLFPRDAFADIRLHLKPITLSFCVQRLIVGEAIADSFQQMIVYGEPKRLASFDDLINTGRAH